MVRSFVKKLVETTLMQKKVEVSKQDEVVFIPLCLICLIRQRVVFLQKNNY